MTKTTSEISNDRVITIPVIVHIPISEIQVDRNWNVRKYLGDDSEGGPEEHSFSDLVENLALDGQYTPVRVRKIEGCDDHKYALVEGFRRITAISKIYQSGRVLPGLEPGYIKAFVENVMTELEALVRNGAENTGRSNLNMADTAFLVHRLYEQGLSEPVIATRLALSFAYVNQLHTVYKGLNPLTIVLKDGRTMTAFDHWREAPGRIPFRDLLELARVKIDPRIKEMKYMAIISAKKEKAENGEKKEKQNIRKNEFSLAETYGCMLGRLEAKGLISVTGDWSAILEHGKRIKLADQSPEYKTRILSSAKSGYTRGLNS